MNEINLELKPDLSLPDNLHHLEGSIWVNASDDIFMFVQTNRNYWQFISLIDGNRESEYAFQTKEELRRHFPQMELIAKKVKITIEAA